MTLREILARRAQRHQKVAESRKSALSRKLRRERLAERKLNHFIESRENMINKRKHYILVEDEQNDDDLVEIETADVEVDDTPDVGEDMNKEDIVKTLEDLAAQLGLKVVKDDEKEDEDPENDQEKPEDVEVETEVEVKDDEVEQESKTCEGDGCKVTEADKEETEKVEDEVEVKDEVDSEESGSDAEEKKEDSEEEKSEEDESEKFEAEETTEEIAKKLAEFTTDDWMEILATVE